MCSRPRAIARMPSSDSFPSCGSYVILRRSCAGWSSAAMNARPIVDRRSNHRLTSEHGPHVSATYKSAGREAESCLGFHRIRHARTCLRYFCHGPPNRAFKSSPSSQFASPSPYRNDITPAAATHGFRSKPPHAIITTKQDSCIGFATYRYIPLTTSFFGGSYGMGVPLPVAQIPEPPNFLAQPEKIHIAVRCS